MSVTGCYLDRMLESSIDDLNRGSYKLRYKVLTGGAQGPISLVNQAASASPDNLPTIWSTFSYLGDTDPSSYAREYRIQRDEKSVLLYYVEVSYKPLEPGEIKGDDVIGSTANRGAPINSSSTPITRPALIWWDRETFTQQVEHTVLNGAIANPTGAPFEDAEEKEWTRGILVVEKNVATMAEVIDLSTRYERAVNSVGWNLGGKQYPARNALCREVSASPARKDNALTSTSTTATTFYTAVMRFVFADYNQTWDTKRVARGATFWKKVDSSPGSPYIMDGANRKRFAAPNGEPVLLNTDGTLLPEGQAPVIQTFRVFREVDFNALGL